MDDKMGYKEKLIEAIEENHGIIFTKDVEALEIPRQFIYRLVKKGYLIKVIQGAYRTEDAAEDSLYIIQGTNNLAIYSHETALMLHGFIENDDTLDYVMTIPSGYNASRLNELGVKSHYIKKELYELGLTRRNTATGRQVRVYDIERTVCDIIRNRNTTKDSIVNQAIKGYISYNDKDLDKLMTYAKQLKIDSVVKKYLEA